MRKVAEPFKHAVRLLPYCKTAVASRGVCFASLRVSLRSLIHLLNFSAAAGLKRSQSGSCSREGQEGACCPSCGRDQLPPARGMAWLPQLLWHLDGAIHGSTQFAGVDILFHLVARVTDPVRALDNQGRNVGHLPSRRRQTTLHRTADKADDSMTTARACTSNRRSRSGAHRRRAPRGRSRPRPRTSLLDVIDFACQ